MSDRKTRIAARRLIANHGRMAMQAACDLYDAANHGGELDRAAFWEDVKVAIDEEDGNLA